MEDHSESDAEPGLSSIERQANSPYAQQWNFNIQREVARQSLDDDNYSPPGPGNIDAKRPYLSATIPGTGVVISPGAIHGYHFDGNSIHRAMAAKLEKRFSKGLTLLTAYTYSKAIGDVCGNSAAGDTSNCGFQDLRNLRTERSVDNIDIPQRFVLSGVYEIPFGKGHHFGSTLPGPLNALFGGWSTGSILTRAMGRPYNVINSGNPANTGTLRW